MSWKEKFDQRCRMVLGVPDSTDPVYINTKIDLGGCDTCGYNADDPIEMYCGSASRSYAYMSDLINDIDKVLP